MDWVTTAELIVSGEYKRSLVPVWYVLKCSDASSTSIDFCCPPGAVIVKLASRDDLLEVN